MTSEDLPEDADYQPRPNDFLVEPIFAPFERDTAEESEVEPKGGSDDRLEVEVEVVVRVTLVTRVVRWFRRA